MLGAHEGQVADPVIEAGLRALKSLPRVPSGGRLAVAHHQYTVREEPLYGVHTTPTQVLWATTWRPWVVPRAGVRVQGVRRLPPCLRAAPPPQQRATCEGERSTLVRAGGRWRIA